MANRKHTNNWTGMLTAAVFAASTLLPGVAAAEEVHILGDWNGTTMSRAKMVSIINEATGGDSSLTVDLSRIPASMTEAELRSQMGRSKQISDALAEGAREAFANDAATAPATQVSTAHQGLDRRSAPSMKNQQAVVEASQRQAMEAIAKAMANEPELEPVKMAKVMLSPTPVMASTPAVTPVKTAPRVHAAPQVRVKMSDPVSRGLREYYHGDFVGAVDYFSQAISENPDDVAARFYLGYSHYRLGEHQQAREAFIRAYAIDPGFSPVVPPTRNP